MKHFNYLLIAAVLFAVGCKQEEAQTAPDQKVWTKTMIYSVDIEKTFFDDPEDEDFSEFSELFREVVQGVYDGDLQAYEYWAGDPISADSAHNMFIHVDTLYIENPETQKFDMRVVKTDYSEDILSIKIKEKWYFDKENWKIEKDVVAIAPRVPVYNPQTGELRGYSPLFWIFLDKEEEKAFVKVKKEQLDS